MLLFAELALLTVVAAVLCAAPVVAVVVAPLVFLAADTEDFATDAEALAAVAEDLAAAAEAEVEARRALLIPAAPRPAPEVSRAEPVAPRPNWPKERLEIVSEAMMTEAITKVFIIPVFVLDNKGCVGPLL
jgi:hypothetical protein